MFKSFTALAALLAAASVASAAPASQVKTGNPIVNIVYNPMITYPTAGVVWTVGETKEITWNTADIPEEETNSTGTILLGYNENDSENLNIATPLATGFKIMDGKVNVTVPQTDDRDDYIVVLFGDSGNASKEFTIQSADADASSLDLAAATIPSSAAATATSSIPPSATA